MGYTVSYSSRQWNVRTERIPVWCTGEAGGGDFGRTDFVNDLIQGNNAPTRLANEWTTGSGYHHIGDSSVPISY